MTHGSAHIESTPYRTDIVVGGHAITADEPPALGGKARALHPMTCCWPASAPARRSPSKCMPNARAGLSRRSMSRCASWAARSAASNGRWRYRAGRRPEGAPGGDRRAHACDADAEVRLADRYPPRVARSRSMPTAGIPRRRLRWTMRPPGAVDHGSRSMTQPHADDAGGAGTRCSPSRRPPVLETGMPGSPSVTSAPARPSASRRRSATGRRPSPRSTLTSAA